MSLNKHLVSFENMASKEMYIVLSSDNSSDTYRNNDAFTFTVDLPKNLVLDGNWLCALQSFNEDAFVSGFKRIFRCVLG